MSLANSAGGQYEVDVERLARRHGFVEPFSPKQVAKMFGRNAKGFYRVIPSGRISSMNESLGPRSPRYKFTISDVAKYMESLYR